VVKAEGGDGAGGGQEKREGRMSMVENTFSMKFSSIQPSPLSVIPPTLQPSNPPSHRGAAPPLSVAKWHPPGFNPSGPKPELPLSPNFLFPALSAVCLFLFVFISAAAAAAAATVMEGGGSRLRLAPCPFPRQHSPSPTLSLSCRTGSATGTQHTHPTPYLVWGGSPPETN